jgi:hypothetical protein
MPNISKEDLITQLVQLGIDQHSDPRQLRENVTVLVEKSGLLDKPEGEPLEYLLDGMRVKLNFNKMGNMTSLSNMEHELQGRWVCFVGAENDKHLKATHPAAFTQLEDNGSDWIYRLKFICRVLEGDPPAQDKATALGMARSLLTLKHSEAPFTPIIADMVTDEMLKAIKKETPMHGVVTAERVVAIYNAVNAYMGAKK